MAQTDFPSSIDTGVTLQQAVADAKRRASNLKVESDAASKEAVIWEDLLSFHDKGWWFHLRAVFDREAEFFRRVRASGEPVINQLEALFRQAKERTDDLIHELPRDIERMAQEHKLPLDRAKSGHPKYRFRDGFLTLEINDARRTARLGDYEEKLGEMPPDIDAIAQAIKQHDKRLFSRPFEGAKFLEKLRRSYLAILKKEKKQDGDPVPLRSIARRLADNEKKFRRDEFLIDLSRLAEEGPPATGGYKFEFQQTKDTDQGFLLHGPSGRGMINLLIFRKVTP